MIPKQVCIDNILMLHCILHYIPSTNNSFLSLPAASSLSSMNGSSVIFASDQNNILVCSSNFQSQQNQVAPPVMGEITADQILDMPIVFADEPSLEEMDHTSDNNSYFITSSDNQKIIVKEEVIDEDGNLGVICSTRSAAIPERLNIKQVYLIILSITL